MKWKLDLGLRDLLDLNQQNGVNSQTSINRVILIGHAYPLSRLTLVYENISYCRFKSNIFQTFRVGKSSNRLSLSLSFLSLSLSLSISLSYLLRLSPYLSFQKKEKKKSRPQLSDSHMSIKQHVAAKCILKSLIVHCSPWREMPVISRQIGLRHDRTSFDKKIQKKNGAGQHTAFFT